MRILLLLFFWACCFAPNLQAQTVQSVWVEMEDYVALHLGEEIPNEANIVELFRIDLQQEGPQVEGEELVELVRRDYWQKIFMTDNKERITQAKEADKNAKGTPIANPDLTGTCPLNIVVIVDRSGSIMGSEVTNIRAGLLALVSNIVGTGNSLTFVGMGGVGSTGGPAITSQTVTYNPGNTNIHTNWINNILSFGISCDQCDSWSTGLDAAIGLTPDLVMMITDGNDDHGDDEDDLTIAAANTLKSNGANDGNGAHIFVFGEETNDYVNYADPSIVIEFSEAVDLFIASNPDEAPVPPTFLDIGMDDYLGFSNNSNFGQLSSWLSNLQFFSGEIETVNILNQPCNVDFGVRGNYEICQGSVTSINLQIWENFTVVATVAASINTSNNTWSFSAPFSQLENLGLQDGHSYDIIPVMTLSNGTVVTGNTFVPGVNNDFLFEIVDCCDIPATIISIPECVRLGEVFSVIVRLESSVTAAEIDEIYSDNNNYTYVDHSVFTSGTVTFIFIEFISNTCTCEGEMLIFDIRLFDCGPVIWFMTDNIPCCAEECKTVTINDWHYDDCTIVNGNPARYFCLEVTSSELITDVFAATNDVFCQTTLVDLEVTNIPGTNNYSICGFMVFSDPDCTFHAKVSLKIETANSCCTIEHSFSFPKGCDLDEDCLASAAELEIIIGGGIDVSIDIPQGEIVTVHDHIANTTNDYTVGLVHCGPFAISFPGGSVDPGNPNCNGIVLPTPSLADCFDEDIMHPEVNYYYEIEWNNCVWLLIGNYCNETMVIFTPGVVKDRNQTPQAVTSLSEQIKVFPNPMDQSGALNFDFGTLETAVLNIEVKDVSGKTIESFIPAQDQNLFQYQLNQPLLKGIYFLVFYTEDGQVSSTKLVSLE